MGIRTINTSQLTAVEWEEITIVCLLLYMLSTKRFYKISSCRFSFEGQYISQEHFHGRVVMTKVMYKSCCWFSKTTAVLNM